MLMPQHQYYNVDPTLPQRDSKFNLLYTMDVVKLSKRCCNIEITTSYSKFLHNIDNETSRSQRRTNVVSTLDSKLTSKHILNVLMAISIQRGLVNVKFTKAYQRWYYVETTTLRQVWEKRKMWTIIGRFIPFPQPCLKVVKKFNNGMTFVWYAGSILWYQIQSFLSLSNSKSFQKLFSKGLEISRMLSCLF